MTEKKVADRRELTVKFLRRSEYVTNYSFLETIVEVYTFEEVETKQIYVWKTSGCGLDVTYNSILKIKGTIKGEKDYKGVNQIELSRVKLLEVISRAKTKEEITEEKQKAQYDSLEDGDTVLTMPYKQYKERYEDCETLYNSFYREGGKSYIQVIVRNGRLKNSGVRGRHFTSYELVNHSRGIKHTFYAVCKENAYKQAVKAFPGSTEEQWEVSRVY